MSWAVLMFFIGILSGIYYRLGRIAAQTPRSRVRIRSGLAHITMMAPSQISGVAYPPWEKMCEDISESRILEKVGAVGPPWSTESSNPNPIEIFTHSDDGNLTAIYTWWLLSARVLNRNRDYTKPEPGEVPPAEYKGNAFGGA